MSTKGEVLYHPTNGSIEETWDGFSWPAFFFGVIWLAVKQLWVHFIVSLVILFGTAGFGGLFIWIFYGFKGNEFHKSALLSKGYLTKAQYEQRKESGTSAAGLVNAGGGSSTLNVADELTKLAQLRDSGALTDEEFTRQKSKLLSA